MADNTRKVGKIILVDPNSSFGDGHSSSDNMSVPLEDLNISAQLSATKKARTLITSSKEAVSTVETSKEVNIKFIEGATINGKKSLTTNYTDLTTIFDKDSKIDTETLGISNIDIDFNSSYAPQITINFIDIRGSSIFQNEGDIGGSNSISNKYSVFFQLPYPLFQLTIKGYYGKPVKYCLHMTKFNAKFNSQTGNFEITANFIGYTYAMLSDMLIGYLKAIPYTKEGISAYGLINSDRETPVDNLNQLMVKISKINESISKISATDINAIEIKVFNNKFDILNRIGEAINLLGSSINPTSFFNNSLTADEYNANTNANSKSSTLVESTGEILGSNTKNFIVSRIKTNVNQYNSARGNDERVVLNNADDAREESAISAYKTNIEKLINDYNSLGGGTPLDLNFYTDITSRTSQLLKRDVKVGVTSITPSGGGSPITPESNDEKGLSKFETLRKTYEEYFTKNSIGEYHYVSFIKVDDLYSQIDQYKRDFTQKITTATKELAETVKTEIIKSIHFDPTIRNIIEVFTSAVEAFLISLHNVSIVAESNTVRNSELKLAFSKDDNSDINNNNINFYPWPDYKEQGVDGYVEKYLGSPGVLSDPSLINELVFIDDLYKAFITAAKEAENTLNDLSSTEKNWVPINPFDTRIFISESPYNRIEGLKQEELYGLILVRAMTFLGYSNQITELSDAIKPSIEQMAQSEAHLILKDISSTTLKSVITSNTNNINNIIGTKINNTNIVTLNGGKYYYDFIFNGNSSSFNVLPVSMERFTDKWYENLDYDAIKMITGLVEHGESETFLTNYSDAQSTLTTTINKPDDGGKYVKILTKNQYGSDIKELSENVIPTDNTLILEKLKNNRIQDFWNTLNLSEAGFNVFGGLYGVEEFDKLDYGKEELKNLPLRFVFYGDKESKSSSKLLNGLGVTRKNPTLYNFINKLTPSDKSQVPSYEKISKIFRGDEPNEKYQTTSNSVENFGKNRDFFNSDLNEITYPYVNISYQIDLSIELNVKPVSLFGSKLYYGQQNTVVNGIDITNYNQAMLFLSTLPWNSKTFEPNEILNLFANRSGFIHAPRLWCSYIGSLLWRADSSNPIIDNGVIVNGGSGPVDPIQWFSDTITTFSYAPGFTKASFASGKNLLPTRTEYIDVLYPDKTVYRPDQNIKEIHYLLKSIPDQVKNEFKKIFFDFVNGSNNELTSWRTIADNLEIWPKNKTVSSFSVAVNNLIANTHKDNNGLNYLDDSFIKNGGFINIDKYNIITPLLVDKEIQDKSTIELTLDGNMMLELNGGYNTTPSNGLVNPVRVIIDAMKEELIIANATPTIWGNGTNGNNLKTNTREKISVTKDVLDSYLTSMLDELKKTPVSEANEEKRLQQEVFGSSDTNVIKAQLYRTCKNIYDKWLGGVTNKKDIIFQCGGRNSLDKELAINSRGSKSDLRLIDSFRFVSRSFADIGDKFYINPTPVNTYLTSNPNASFYDAVSNLLSANNFDFIALPSFINFNSAEDVKAMFETKQYEEALEDGISGPSFVCVYVGQKSKNLHFNGSDYTNDGFDIRFDNYKDKNILPVPEDFSTEGNKYENNVPVFTVNYSQQNQNIFKDISLDQNEFTETAESLQVVDDISKMGAPNNRSFAGQNIYNVYAVRSYKAEVEMMGNAMVQPMMYFQLNNIPMFHGAYMITHVKHNIKPNFMSTHFTGVRIKAAQTPLITGADMYASLLNSLDVSLSSSNDDVVRAPILNKGIFPPIVKTIIENNGTNGNIVVNNITTKPIEVPVGIKNMISDTNQLLSEAVAPLKAMLTAWVAWMKANGFSGDSSGNYAYLNSAFRTYNQQEDVRRKYPDSSAVPGTSKHGWGIAIDLQYFRKDGSIIKNYVDGKPNVDEGYDLTDKGNPSLVWLLNNSYAYGWIIPEQLRDNVGTEEFWHFEYHGTAAACILRKRPTIKTITVNVNQPYSGVTNPKDSKGVAAIYPDNECEYTNVDGYDGTLEVLLAANPKIQVTPPSSDDIDFYTKVLSGVKANQTSENLKFMYAWRKAESGTAAWNPFNTTKKAEGTTNYNKNNNNPVKNYPSKEVGIKATVDTLNASYYTKIVSGLQNDIGADKLSYIIDELKTWGTGAGISTVLNGSTLVPPRIQITTDNVV